MGRQILENIIIVQESIHSSMERKQQGMVIKLDMTNAFDIVNHFLELYYDNDETVPEAQVDLLSGIPSLITDLDNIEL